MTEPLVVTIKDLAQALHFTEEDYDKQPMLTKNDKICWGRAREMMKYLLKRPESPDKSVKMAENQ